MSDLVLYNYFRSSTSYRVRLAMNYKNLNYEYRPINLIKEGGQQHSESYRELNPMSGVPTLIHGEFHVAQSVAILEYLDEAFPEKPIFPQDSKVRARVREVCEIINADTHSYANLRTLQYLQEKCGLNEEGKKLWIHHFFTKSLIALEAHAQTSGARFFFGNQITAADFLLIPMLFTAQRFELDTKPYPNLSRINTNITELDFAKLSHPFAQPDTPEDLRWK
jgi:maleylacetoacetate isomerase